MVIRSVLLIKKVEYCFRPSVDMLILCVCKETCLFETIPQVETNKMWSTAGSMTAYGKRGNKRKLSVTCFVGVPSHS
jgi:hypothetical protein